MTRLLDFVVMDHAEVSDMVKLGDAALREARDTRGELRWQAKPGDPAREAELHRVLRLIDDVMRPIRSAIGKLVWEPISDRDERRLRATSKALQYERRQLKKMRR